MGRNLYGIIPIKVRAKDSSTIDLSSITIDDLEIEGSFASAKGGKLILLDIRIIDSNDENIVYNGITTLNEFGYVGVVGINSVNPSACFIDISDSDVNIYNI